MSSHLIKHLKMKIILRTALRCAFMQIHALFSVNFICFFKNSVFIRFNVNVYFSLLSEHAWSVVGLQQCLNLKLFFEIDTLQCQMVSSFVAICVAFTLTKIVCDLRIWHKFRILKKENHRAGRKWARCGRPFSFTCEFANSNILLSSVNSKSLDFVKTLHLHLVAKCMELNSNLSLYCVCRFRRGQPHQERGRGREKERE